MNKYATVAGVLSIVSGSLGILGGLSIGLFAGFVSSVIWLSDSNAYNAGEISSEELAAIVGWVYGGIGIFLLLLGVLALVGGIFALRRKLWGLALAGSIGALFSFFPVGIVAVIFTSMARLEFSSDNNPSGQPPLLQ